MKTYTTTQGQDFQVTYATSSPAGYGHREISVDITLRNGDHRTFTCNTNNMPAYDEACELEGQAKHEALFEIVETSLDGKICEWAADIEE